MTAPIVLVLPAPPHPAARNTAARYYAALLEGLSGMERRCRVLAMDDGGAESAQEWTSHLPGVTLETFASEPLANDVMTKGARWRRPMFDAAPKALRARLAAQLSEPYDVLHVEEFLLGPLTAGRDRSLLSVLHSEARDLRAVPASGIRSSLRQARMRRAERLVIRAQSRLRTISPELEADLRAMGARAPIDVIPLCLSLDRYDFRPSERPRTVGLIGSMRWPPTRAAALLLLQRVWPAVMKAQPTAELLVAGWGADTLKDAVARLRGVSLLSDLPDYRDFFDQVGLLAFPLSVGSGMKIKVMESMAMGVPVATTPQGREGLALSAEPAWYEARSPEQLAPVIIEALQDEKERETRARRARRLLEDRYAPPVVAGQMTSLYQQVGGRAG